MIGYETLNTARSALSALGVTQDGYSIGYHPFTMRYMNGVFNMCPPMPKYNETWDVSAVLAYLETLSPVDDISLKILSYKLAICLLG